MKHLAEATFEGGVLKLDRQLPLAEGQHVWLVVDTEPSRAQQSSGLLGWDGDAETLERIAMSPDLDSPEESSEKP
jgi:predicted DNA-binding antitoxin AbrB/MazE fold protein